MTRLSSRRSHKTSPVSVGWAIVVPLVAWWPLTFVFVQVQRPSPGEPGNDLAPLLYLPAAVVWLPMVAVTALVAWLAGRRLERRGAGSTDDRKRRNRGLAYGVATLILVPLLLMLLEQLG
jgi:hypothetical protein